MAHPKSLPLVNNRVNLVNNSNNPLRNSRHQPNDSTGMADELCRRNVLCLDLH